MIGTSSIFKLATETLGLLDKFVDRGTINIRELEFSPATSIVYVTRLQRSPILRGSNPRSKDAMRAGALPLQTQISLAPVLSHFAAADEFKKLLASIARSIRTWQLGFAIIALFVSACATPVGVTRLDEQAAHRELTANVLSTGKPSEYSTQLLERQALGERFDQNPERILAELNSGLGRIDERDRLFALSELSFAYAEESGNRSYYLASATYAYAFLFPPEHTDAPGQYDPRLRLAVDLYNRGIALGLATNDGKEVDLSARQLSLPFGSLDLAVNAKGFSYGGYHLTKFVSLADLKVRGLRNTYRRAGIGAALSARVEPSPGSTANRWIPPTAKVPITAFVRFDDPRRAMSDGRLHGTVELYDDGRNGNGSGRFLRGAARVGAQRGARLSLGRCADLGFRDRGLSPGRLFLSGQWQQRRQRWSVYAASVLSGTDSGGLRSRDSVKPRTLGRDGE